MSQDYLELFFGAVRAARNNPTTQQLTAAYKRLLLRSHIKGTNENCEKRNPIGILSAVSNSMTNNGKAITMTNSALVRKYDLKNEPQYNKSMIIVTYQISPEPQSARKLLFHI